jgi:hypothetical protein
MSGPLDPKIVEYIAKLRTKEKEMLDLLVEGVPLGASPRWMEMAKSDIQRARMAAVRSVTPDKD